MQQRPFYGLWGFSFKLETIKILGKIFVFTVKPWAGKHAQIGEVSFGARMSFVFGFCGSRPWFSAIFQSDINMQVRMGEREI